MSDKELKIIVAESCGCIYNQKVMEDMFQWLKNAPNKEDINLRIWCIRSTDRYKDLYDWINHP